MSTNKRYQVAREDFEALEQVAELADQVDLDSERLELMQNPTKAKAAEMYESAIHLWFREHPEHIHTGDEITSAIAERHNITG